MSSSSTETSIDVVMPQMGVSVSEGTIVEWRKQVGDWVAYEEPLVDISTDKIDTEVPSPVAGRLTEIVVAVGETVDVGAVLARLATDAKPGEPHASESARRRRHRPATPPPPRATPRRPRRPTPRRSPSSRPAVATRAATRRSCRASLPSTASTSRRSVAPAAAGACASRTCSRSWRTARPTSLSRRCTSSRPTGPSRRDPRRRPCPRPGATGPPRPSRCRGCAGRSAST